MADYEYSKPHDDFQKLMRTYAGFQMATALIVASKFGGVNCAGIIVSLFAISIPSTYFYPSFVRLTPDDEKRNPAPIMAICFILAFVPSTAAISFLLAPASIFAAIAFPVTGFAWLIVLVVLRKHNQINALSQKSERSDNNVK